MRGGVPFEVAFMIHGKASLNDAERLAMQVVLSEFECGDTFNWETMSWPERK